MSFPPPTERQARVIWLALTGLAVAMLVALVVALLWGLGHVLRMLSPVLLPIAVAGVIAYLLDPVVDFIERRGASRPRAILCVFGLALVIVAAVFGSVVPQLINETRQLAVRIPAYVARIEKRAEYWLSHPPAVVKRLLERESGAKETRGSLTVTNESGPGFPISSASTAAVESTNAPSILSGTLDTESLQTATKWLAGALPKVGSWLFGKVGRLASWIGFLAGLALVPVYTFYFLLEKRGISSHWTNYLPVADSGFKNELVFVLNSINNYLITFFRGQVLVAICDGTLYGIGFLIIGLPYAVLIGVMAVFLTMIPYLGAIVTCFTALVIALVQFGDWSHPLLVLAVFGVVQALEGLYISPRIMGGRVGLHPVTIIIAVMAGTTLLGGLLGGILAIPLTAALRVLMFRYVWKRPGRDA
ncbi:MAG: AI-2E family transporter [Limisphaerales bacterium]